MTHCAPPRPSHVSPHKPATRCLAVSLPPRRRANFPSPPCTPSRPRIHAASVDLLSFFVAPLNRATPAACPRQSARRSRTSAALPCLSPPAAHPHILSFAQPPTSRHHLPARAAFATDQSFVHTGHLLYRASSAVANKKAESCHGVSPTRALLATGCVLRSLRQRRCRDDLHASMYVAPLAKQLAA